MTTADIDWGPAVQQVVWVPVDHRKADVPLATARRMLRCTDRSFAQLHELGLPHEDGPDGPLYDGFDLRNVSLYSGSNATAVEISMRFILGFMAHGSAELTRPIRNRYLMRLPSIAGMETVRWVYRPTPEAFGGRLHSWFSPADPQPVVEGPHFRMMQPGEVTGTLTNSGVEQAVRSSAIRSVMTDLLESGVRWHFLPMSMVLHPDNAIALGAASCSVLCSVLQQRLAAGGYEATAYHGWINASSQVDHAWVEVVDEDGCVKCLDPSLALLAIRNGLGTEDFCEFAVGSMQNRITPTRAPLQHSFVVGGDPILVDTVSFSCRTDETAA